MKKTISIILLITTIIINSCDFRVVKHVGHQYSSQVKWSKKFDVFICSYRPDSESVEKHKKHKINQIFAEHQYKHDGGFFSGFDIEKTKSQIIITDSLGRKTWNKNKSSFAFKGFESKWGNKQYRLSESVVLPDTLKLILEISDFNNKTSSVEKLIYIKNE